MARSFHGLIMNSGNGAASGVTNTTTFGVSGRIAEGRNTNWSYGVFGFSSTYYTAGQNWTVTVNGNASGVSFKIAEIGAITGQSAGILPIVNELSSPWVSGTTQQAFLGIPQPRSVTITGSSTGIGITGSFVVTASLMRAD